jgi:enterochelin esterase family protein
VPTPTILDNLIAAKKIPPTIAVLVPNMGHRNRDLNGSKPFADFIAEELVSWMRSHYSIRPGPESVVVAGSSTGGFASTYCAFMHPELIGNVLSQSGAYWVTKDWQNVRPPYPRDSGMMIQEFQKSKRLPIRFYLEVGRYDLGAALLGSNRELRDVLQAKGYEVDYREFDGGHDYISWRGSLADGLISLLARGN